MLRIPGNNYNHTVETSHGPAIISIPKTADENDILQIKEHLDIIIKHHFHMEINSENKKKEGMSVHQIRRQKKSSVQPQMKHEDVINAICKGK